MKSEIYIIFTMALLVSAALFLIYQDPSQTPRSLSLEKYSREIVQINEKAKSHLDDDVKFNDSKQLMQEKLKEASLEYMKLEISTVDLIDGHYPFRDSQSVAERFDLEKSSVCSIEQKIPLHMQRISQTGIFDLFAKKYSQYGIEFYILDERNYLSNIHYGLSATNGLGQRASTYFHLNSCTDEITDSEPYLLTCSDESDGYRFISYNYEDIVSSFSNSHFCKINLDPWRQSVLEYSEALRDEHKLHMNAMSDLADLESHLEFFSEADRISDLGNIVWNMVQGKFDEPDTQDMIKLYEEQYGSLPPALSDLIEKRGTGARQ